MELNTGKYLPNMYDDDVGYGRKGTKAWKAFRKGLYMYNTVIHSQLRNNQLLYSYRFKRIPNSLIILVIILSCNRSRSL